MYMEIFNKKVISADTSAEVVEQDDNLEFEAGLDEYLTAGDSPEDAGSLAGEIGLTAAKKDALRAKAKSSALSLKQAYRFMSHVELDLLRKDDERLGLEYLFNLYCAKGQKNWLNPIPYINKIDEVLRKYACRGVQKKNTLKPFIDLLVRLAENNVNPSAFLDYIMVTRLTRDHGWRNWRKNHLKPLELIADILIEMYGKPPFDQPTIGNAGNRLSRDIVLVKYVGRPLALYPEDMLADKAMRTRYIEAWRKLNLDSAFVILFMKTNILNFMYAMSGKIDLQQLILIIEQMPEIEVGFRENFPADIFDIDLNKIDLNLYNYDIDRSIISRKNKGYKSFDFITEIKAYLNIIIALLNTNAGIFLCGYFARKLSQTKDPVVAGSLARLVSVLNDRGGKHIYIWHAAKLLGKTKLDHPAYLDQIEANGGCDPSYPNIHRIFTPPELTRYDHGYITKAAQELGFSPEELLAEAYARQGRKVEPAVIAYLVKEDVNIGQIIYKDLINVYIKHHPEAAPIIENYQQQFSAGIDREWDEELTSKIDMLGVPLHYALLKAVIRGLGTGFSFGSTKSTTFGSLYKEYGLITKQNKLEERIDFKLPKTELGDVGKLREAEIKKKVNVDFVKEVWSGFEEAAGLTINNALPFINELSVKLNEPIENLQQAVFQQETDLENNSDKGLEKKLKNSRKGLQVMQQNSRIWKEL